ncbi:aspartate/glutamate racemase family protein [Kordia jejudonensis]|uniref:aspartate/glutamate racemase family protein n=1 Tax=Kordia jejudonensis TaxID=1348245 RepID=UPI0006292480|nr:aspartate/glutamate racemase family protein [Kordia jejudonensis]
MKTIGLIGGITWQSTILYYEVLNTLAAKRLGGKHSAKSIIHTVQFEDIHTLQAKGRWDLLNDLMIQAAKSLENAGADCILICANTMHLTIDAVRANVSIPVIHIAEATAEQIIAKEIETVALLGTKYTMEKDFYKDILASFGIQTLIPNANDRDEIHRIIYDELSKGELNPASKQRYLEVIDRMQQAGAEGIILGCTEIPLLIKQEDVAIPVFDTTTIHATKAIDFALN